MARKVGIDHVNRTQVVVWPRRQGIDRPDSVSIVQIQGVVIRGAVPHRSVAGIECAGADPEIGSAVADEIPDDIRMGIQLHSVDCCISARQSQHVEILRRENSVRDVFGIDQVHLATGVLEHSCVRYGTARVRSTRVGVVAVEGDFRTDSRDRLHRAGNALAPLNSQNVG